MVTEHRFASPQTNVTKQNKPGRTKRYDCIPLPTESATASNPRGGNPALKALDRSATVKVAVTTSPTPGCFIPVIAYRFEGAIHAKFADEPYSHRLDHITLLEHDGAIRKWAIDNSRLDEVNSKALDPIWASAQDDLNQQTAR